MLLTARPMIPQMIPVLIVVERNAESNANSDIDGGFRPFFKCPIYKQYINVLDFSQVCLSILSTYYINMY